MNQKKRVLIVGAGLSGLSLAFHLEQKGILPIICEKGSAVGGRIRTDFVDGFTLDRGFQTILTSYDEVNNLFSKSELGVKNYFQSGAIVRLNGNWTTVKVFTPFFSDFRKLALLLLKNSLPFHGESDLSAKEVIASLNLSKPFVECFLHPFLSGVFLDSTLKTHSSILLRALKQFAFGLAYLPSGGMQTLPNALLKKLKMAEIYLKSPVLSINHKAILLDSGQMLSADKIAVATDASDLKKLIPNIKIPKSCSVSNFYFSLDKKVLAPKPFLYLNGEGGPINNLTFNNLIDESVSLPSKHLISATVVDPEVQHEEHLMLQVREQICRWFNIKEGLEFLRMYHIPHALPMQEHPLKIENPRLKQMPNVYICNELVGEASINGALRLGRDVAEAIAKDFAEEEPLRPPVAEPFTLSIATES